METIHLLCLIGLGTGLSSTSVFKIGSYDLCVCDRRGNWMSRSGFGSKILCEIQSAHINRAWTRPEHLRTVIDPQKQGSVRV